MLTATNFDRIMDSTYRKEIPGVIMAVANETEQIIGARGNLSPQSQYFIASATKLYVTALILQLIDSKLIKLEDRIVNLFPHNSFRSLHVIAGNDFTHEITVEHLLSHTSGLPDYFQAKHNAKSSLLEQVISGQDQNWNLIRVLNDAKELGAVFSPGSGRALYSDTNFQILGAIIEKITETNLANAIQNQLCQRIGLTNTYLYQDEADTRPAPLNYKSAVLKVPKAMTSFGADGGIVSTAQDGIDFLKSFFAGQLFDESHLSYITAHWRKIFFPLKYGVGISLFRLPWFFSPFKRAPDLIGHSGLSGTLLFYCPANRLYLSGTVNQTSHPEASFRMMVKSVTTD
ncbi:MAG: beta-lactamase family protein [Deltaproteobacteria bacterium]|nr:beta-lactamase family protein [Deltaproteobacteria bacterium]